jgi:hypothetical protein
MRKLTAVVFLLLCLTGSMHGQKMRFGQPLPEKPNPADYSIRVHISGTHIRNYCIEPGASVSCSNGLFADAVLNGKKFELFGKTMIDKHEPALLIPGDYPARLTKDFHNADSAVIYQEYDVLLPDSTTWHCVITGISE